MFHSFISQWNIVAAVVWAALFNSLPAVCIVTGCVWLLLDRVKGWSAAMRYAGWCGLLVLAIGLPVAQLMIPHTSVAPAATIAASEDTRAIPALPVATASAPMADATHVSNARTILVTETPVPPVQNHFWGITTGAGLLLLWLAAMLVQLVRLGMALRCNVVLKRSALAPDAEVAARWSALVRSNEDIRRPVRLALSSSITMPAVVGYRRPLVLLPETLAARLSSEELDGILLHELAHVRRRDDWAIAAQRFVQAVFVLHPLVHLIAAKMELQREVACDDWVLRTQQARVYASSLTSVAEFCLRPAHSGLMGLAMERPSQLGERVELLLDSTRPIMTRISLRWLSGFASALGLAMVLSLQLPEVMAFPVENNSPAAPAAIPAPPAVPNATAEQSPSSEPAPSVESNPRAVSTPSDARGPVAIPMKIDPVVVPRVKVNPHVVVTPHVVVIPKIVDEQLSHDRGLTEEQRREIRKQVEAARQQIEKSRAQIEKQLHEQLEPQMRQLREQLSHMDMNRMMNDSARAQREAQRAMSQAMAELSRNGKWTQLTQAQRDKIQAERNRYQAQMAQLRAEQEKTAKEFSDRINAIINESMKQAFPSEKK
jgi:beta-lactamase regulating signal transducer with metallopeptidase domain